MGSGDGQAHATAKLRSGPSGAVLKKRPAGPRMCLDLYLVQDNWRPE